MRRTVVALAFATALSAGELPVSRVAAPPALDGPAPRGLMFSPDGTILSYRVPEPSDANAFDLWVQPVGGGEARKLVDGSSLEPASAILTEAEKARRERQRTAGSRGVVSYAWQGDGSHLLIPASGNLYLADARTGEVRAVGQTAGGATDGQLSPGGRYVLYVGGQNLHAVDLSTDRDQCLTSGGGTVSYGTAEFVAQEEMERFTGYWCSPDDSRVAYTRVDEARVDVVPRVDIGAAGADVVSQRYPRAGRPNAIVQLFVSSLSGGPAVRADLGADDDVYLAAAAWSRDSRVLYAQRESRDQKTLELLAIDPSTGKSRVLITEHGEPWIDLNDDFTPLENGDFLWGSSRTGFHHLYLYRGDGALVHAVTRGDWAVASRDGAGVHPPAVASVDEEKGIVYFIGSVETPLERHLYSVGYREPGAPKRITRGEGWWGINMSKDHRHFLGSYSDPTTPPQTGLYALSGERLRWIEENRIGPGHPYAGFIDHRPVPSFQTIKAPDGTLLYTELLKPYGFDPSKRYPAVVSVYGGPGVQTVRRTWGADSDQLLTQAGYVVFRLDNRGSSNRGVAFEAPIYRAMGGIEVKDQQAGLAYLQSLPFVDARRIGVMGWSYGGYMTLCLLCDPKGGFAAGAAGGAPSDWRLYDTHYTERYMGDPTRGGAAYDRSALFGRLPALARPGAPKLLLLHGMADDNVVFENATRVIEALQDQGTVFDMAVYPGQRHGVRAPSKQAQLWETYLSFFARTLGGKTPRPES